MNAGKMKPLNVLVVDDAAANRKLMSVMLQKMGYFVTLAEDGSQALALCEQFMPDLVLMDVQMPVMNGFDAVREMRRRYTAWFPILFLSAQTGNKEVVEGLRAGGDDYLFKPVQYEVLKAKMHLFHVRLEQNNRLLDYKERIEEETNTARVFIEQFTALGKISDPCVRFLLKPAESFSGDLIAFARAPDNCLHVLLADSAGHGLTAALAVIPITHPFYQMTAKGFDIVSILNELNARVRDYLPLPRFVAAAIASINFGTGLVAVWNGGLPPILLTSEDGTQIVHRFKSSQLPLGVVKGAEFDNTLEYYSLDGQSVHMMMCSDGVTEIDMGGGQMLGHNNLLQEARHSSAAHLFDRVSKVIEDKLTDVAPADDIALIMVDCSPVAATEEPLASRQKAKNPDVGLAVCAHSASVNPEWEISLLLKAQQLKHLDVVPFLLSAVRQIEGGQTDSKLFLIVSELFNNALDHGVLKLDSTLKNQQDGMELYFDQRVERLARLEVGQIAMRFERINYKSCECLKLSVSDSGDGFDYSKILSVDLNVNQQRHGRGIGLLLAVCNSLQYFGNGSEVVAYIETPAPDSIAEKV